MSGGSGGSGGYSTVQVIPAFPDTMEAGLENFTTSTLKTIGPAVTMTEGVASPTVTLETFTDADPRGSLSELSATIDWADGTTTAGMLGSGPKGTYTVSGSHLYSEEGDYPVSIQVLSSDSFTYNDTSTVHILVQEKPLTATPVNFSTADGAANSNVTVASFTDPEPGNGPSSYSATIDWGDGATSTGSISGSGGSFNVAGSHTYNSPGSYTVGTTIATVMSPRSPVGTVSTTAVAQATATVAEQPISAAGVTVTPAAEGGTTTVAAKFVDPNRADQPGDYAATVDWGDGSLASAMSVGVDGQGNVTATGGHIYVDSGNYTITITMQDDAGTPVTQTGTAVIADAPLSAGSVNFQAAQATPFTNQAVATFTDANTNDAPQEDTAGSDYTTTINWGDGTPLDSSGVIPWGDSGNFTLLGGHQYASPGSFTITATITDDGGNTVTATSTATVSSVSPVGTTFSASEGVALNNVTVASFTDSAPNTTPSSYRTSIDWGDGATSNGSISGSGGSYSIQGSHTYSEGGPFTVSVTIVDPLNISVTATTSASVSDPPLSVSANSVAATQWSPLSNAVVATFTDAGPLSAVGDYTATIDWGDTSGLEVGVLTQSGTTFSVIGQHTYSAAGSYPLTVSVQEGAGTLYTSSATATVAPQPLMANGQSPRFTEGSSSTVTVASVSDSTSAAVAATIDWGDGSPTTSGTVVGSGGSYTVTGSHAYSDNGHYTVAVTATDAAGNTDTGYATADVADASLSATPLAISPTQGTPFNGTVATFTDANPNDPPASYLALIDWGDGTPSSVGAVGGSNGTYTVGGTHNYAEEGNYALTVTILDQDGNSQVSASATASVSTGIVATGAGLVMTAGVPATQITVAQFNDPDQGDAAGSYSATINWGDGSSSSGTIYGQNGSFSVGDDHTYASPGTYAISVTISDPDRGTVTAAGQAQVNDPLIGVAHFTDSNSGTTSSSYSATIDWGDGTGTSPGIIGGSNNDFYVTGRHVYADSGGYPLRVAIFDSGGNQVEADSQITVSGVNILVSQGPAVAAPPAAALTPPPTVTINDGIPDGRKNSAPGLSVLINDDFTKNMVSPTTSRNWIADYNPDPSDGSHWIKSNDPLLVPFTLVVGPQGSKGTLSWSGVLGSANNVIVYREFVDANKKSNWQPVTNGPIVAGTYNFRIEGIKIGSAPISVTYTRDDGKTATDRIQATVYSGLRLNSPTSALAKQLLAQIETATRFDLNMDPVGNVFVNSTSIDITSSQLFAQRYFWKVQGNKDTSVNQGTTEIYTDADSFIIFGVYPGYDPRWINGSLDPTDIQEAMKIDKSVGSGALIHELYEQFLMKMGAKPLGYLAAHSAGDVAEAAVAGGEAGGSLSKAGRPLPNNVSLYIARYSYQSGQRIQLSFVTHPAFVQILNVKVLRT